MLFSRAQGLLSHQFRAFRLLGLLMAINISLSLLSSGPPIWVAELCAAVAGFISAALIQPGGLASLMAKFRRQLSIGLAHHLAQFGKAKGPKQATGHNVAAPRHQ